MRPALALSPSSRPSTPPAARAMTFLVAAQSSTPITSPLAYTRRAGDTSACWSSTASSESALATTVAAGSPSPISSAWFGPERTATGRSRTSSERRRPLSGSSPFVSTSTGQRPGSSRVTSAKARLGTATATRLGLRHRRLRDGRDGDARQVDVTQVARIPARRGDRGGLLRVAAGERDLMAAVAEERGEHRSPRTSAYDNDVHDRRTKSITTGTPASAKRSRMRFSTQ